LSILAKLRAETEAPSKPYILVMGKSTSGKSTLCGTLSGRTLFLEVKGKEFGGQSAAAMARSRGNQVDVVTLGSVKEFLALAEELKLDMEYDNVVLDSYSALTFLIADEPEVEQVIVGKKGNTFQAFDKIRFDTAKVHRAISDLTYATVAKKPKVVVCTVAFDVKQDGNGAPADLLIVQKGRASYQEYTRSAPTIVTLAAQNTETGLKRVMLTANAGIYLGRVNGLLDSANPKIMEPDLAALLTLMESK
jgi:energy-coupling factor transporter ATP-binding protein EcfA2